MGAFIRVTFAVALFTLAATSVPLADAHIIANPIAGAVAELDVTLDPVTCEVTHIEDHVYGLYVGSTYDYKVGWEIIDAVTGEVVDGDVIEDTSAAIVDESSRATFTWPIGGKLIYHGYAEIYHNSGGTGLESVQPGANASISFSYKDCVSEILDLDA